MTQSFNGLRVIFSEAMMTETLEPNFPFSMNRSKRIHKKLLKRHGYKKVPRMDAVVSQSAGFMVIHPAAWDALKRMVKERPPREGRGLDVTWYEEAGRIG
jgi:hypothetical protein